jgi:hypothetical protein
MTKDWIRLVTVLYLLKEWPLGTGKDAVAELSASTGKEPAEVLDIFLDLSSQGILEIHQGRVTGFDREKVWTLIERT